MIPEASVAILRYPAYRADMPGRAPFLQSSVFKLLVFLLGTMLLGALLAPPLYLGGKHAVAQGWLADGWLDGLHGSMERAKFSRYFNRSVLAAALLLIWPTLRWLKAGGPRRDTAAESAGGKGWLLRDLRLSPNPWWWGHLFAGFLLAAVSLLLIHLKRGRARHNAGDASIRTR